MKPRSHWIGEGKPKKPLPRVNVARAEKRATGYRAGLAAYRKSEAYRVVEARAGGRCERVRDGVRCTESRENGDKMTHNHTSYQRFGGRELPSDVELLGPACNAEYEAARPWRRRGTR
jgi:hypothetical protein